MAGSRTIHDLVTATLQRLAVADDGANISAADFQLVKNRYADKLEDWRDENLVYWEENEIPGVVFATIVSLMSNEVASAYGKGGSAADMMATETLLLKRLRRHCRVAGSGRPIPATYY